MASNSQDNRGRKPRNYYVDYSKGQANRFRDRRRGQTSGSSNNSRYQETPGISFGHRGFLITSVDEVKSYLEMRNILEEYFEQLYRPEGGDENQEDVNKETTTEEDLELELKQLRKNRPFKQVKTYCRNSLFINIVKEFSHIDPNLIVDKFFDEMAEKRELRTSNTFKVLPVLDTFRNTAACAKEAISNLLGSKYKDETGPKKYFIEFQSRGNHKLDSEDKQKMIEEVAEKVSELRPNWSVDRENADYIIVLVSLKNVCCVSILEGYFKRCKYNVIEFCKDWTSNSNAQQSVDPEKIADCGVEADTEVD